MKPRIRKIGNLWVCALVLEPYDIMSGSSTYVSGAGVTPLQAWNDCMRAVDRCQCGTYSTAPCTPPRWKRT